MMADKGIKIEEPKPLDEKALAEEELKRTNAKDDELSEMELVEKNEDNMRADKKEEKKKNDAYDSISEE